MNRKATFRFVLALCLAAAGLAALFGLLGGVEAQAYAAASHPASHSVGERYAPRMLPPAGLSPASAYAPAASPPAAPLYGGAAASSVITVCKPTGLCDYDSVQAAVSAADPGDIVKVAQGVYTDVNTDGYVVEITKTLTLRGGYTTTNWTLSDPDGRPTILDGEGAVRVVRISAGGPTVEGFHIQNGHTVLEGAGVYVAGGSPVVRRNRVHDNGAGTFGGGVYVAAGSPVLENNLIYANTTGDQGGGVYIGGSGSTLFQFNTLYDNRATNVGSEGGGVYIASGTPSVYASIVVSNVAASGGGIYKEVNVPNDVKYNDVFGNTPDDFVGFGGTPPGNISFAPQFVDLSGANFRLRAGSPCIGRDDPDYPNDGPDDDYDGYARPFDAWWDIGAHEFYTGTCFARIGGGRVFTTVQAAVYSATAGAEVWVAGYCTGSGSDPVVNLDRAITLRGGYTKTHWSSADRNAYPTILDGEDARRVIYVASDVQVVVEGFHIRNGSVSGDHGGGIYVTGDNQTSVIRNNWIYSNSVNDGFGGGVYLAGGSPTVQGNEVYSNTCSSGGGGIYLAGNSRYPTLDSNWIHHNQVTAAPSGYGGGGIGVSVNASSGFVVTIQHNEVCSNTSDGHGGGINVRAGFVVIRDNDIYSNTTELSGGGVYILQHPATVEDNRIYLNRVTADNGNEGGGGIYTRGDEVVLRGNSIYHNSVAGACRGGGIHIWVSAGRAVTVENNRIYGNASATNDGGGLFARVEETGGSASRTSVRNNLIYTNTTEANGGGLTLYTTGDSVIEVDSNTIYDNRAGNNGGGVYKLGGANHFIRNNVVVSNTNYGIYGSFAPTYNDVWGNTVSNYGGGASSTTDISSNPLFTDPAVADFHLGVGSPCIDAVLTTTHPAYDYDGYARPFGARADMGAYEFYSGDCFVRLSTGGRVYTSVQAAVYSATTGVDDVLVAGLCQGAGAMATIDKSLALRGGYTLTNWISPTTLTTLDAQGQGRVVTITAAAPATVTVERFVIMGGDAGVGNGAGIYVSTPISPTIQNVVFYSNTTTGNGGGFASSGGNPRLYNDTFVYNTGGGIYLNGGSPVVSNTIVVSNTGDGIRASGGSPALAYNDVWGNSGAPYNGPTAGATDISENPRFANPAAGDFHLRFDSPCLHAADPDTGLAWDFEGDTRPDGIGEGRRYDIGADEATDYLGVSLGPDLDKEAVPGQVVTYTNYLTNTGTRQDDFSITHTLIVSGGTSGWSVGYDPNHELSPGEATAVPVTVSVPTGVVSGTQATLLLTVTSQSGAPYFLDVAVDTTLVKSSWGFVIAPASAQQSADPGEVVTHTHILTNAGGTDTFTLTLSSDLGWAEIIPADKIENLGSGLSTPIYVRVSVPITASGDAAETTIVEIASVGAANAGGEFRRAVTDTTDVNYTYGDRYVATDGRDDGGRNSCLVFTSPCRTVGQAVGQASGGEVVKVAEGTYQEHDLALNETVILRGGYTTTNWTVSDPTAHPTVIDAQAQGRVLYIGGSPVVEGFILRNGDYNGYGGGVYVAMGAAPTIRRNIITNNTARSTVVEGRGGGVYNAGGDLTLEQNTLADNMAGKYGGGFYNRTGNPLIGSNVFHDNEAADSGGGFYNAGGGPRVWNNTFVFNTAGYGGGVFLAAGDPVVSNTIIVSNTAGVNGGGVYSQAVDGTLDYNDVWHNVNGDYVGLTAGSHSIATDPLFLDAAGGNFHLLKGSPCINIGDMVAEAVLAEDLDGQPREMDGVPDIGADEYQRADVALLSLDDTQVGDQGEVLTYTHVLTNIGNYDDYFLLTWRSVLTDGWTVRVNGYTTQPVTVPTLSRNATTTVEVLIQVPTDILSSTVNETTITATSQVDTDISDAAVNTTIAGQTVGVDLEPSVRFNQTGWGDSDGSTVVYTHTLVNTGNYTDTFGFDVWSSRPPANPDPWPVSISPTPTVELAKGASVVVFVTVTVPSYANELDVHTALVTATSQTAPNPFDVVTDTTIADRTLGVELAPDSTGSAEPGNPVVHTHYLTNTGNYTDTFVLTTSSVRGWPVSITPSPTRTVGPSGTGAVAVDVEVKIPALGIAFGGQWDTTVVTATSLSSPTLSSSVTDVTTATRREGVDLWPGYDRYYEELLPEHTLVSRVVVTSSNLSVVFTHTLRNNTTSNSTDTFTVTISSTPVVDFGVSPTQTGPMAWNETITEYVTITVAPAALHPALAPTATAWVTATSWFSPTGLHGRDTVVDMVIVNQWLGVDLSPGGSRHGPPDGPPGPTGVAIAYTHTVTNTGNYTDSFSLSSAASHGDWSVGFSGPAVVGGDRTVDIGPGMSRVITVEVTVPFTRCSATGVVTVVAESRTPVAGTAGSTTLTDAAVDTITVDPVYYANLTPGFTVRYVSSDTAAIDVTYTRWLTNSGNCDNTFDLGVQGSFTPRLTPTRTSVLSSMLAANYNPTPVAITITLPQTDTTNLVVGTAVVTAAGFLGGFDSVTDTIVVNQHVDVALEPDSSDIISGAGRVSLEYAHTLTNTGNYTDSFDLTWSNEDGWDVQVRVDNGSWSSRQPVVVSSLASSDSVSVDVRVWVEADVYTVTNRTWVTATSATPEAGTAVYSPTATVVDTTLVRRPNVSLGSDRTREVEHGVPMTYYRTLTNTGGLTDTYTITYASEQGWVTSVEPANVNDLPPGRTYPITVVVSVPFGTPYTEHDTVVITATSAMSYTHVVSDVVVDTVNVLYRLDAELTPDYTDHVAPGATITRRHTLTNTGNYTESFTLSTDKEFSDVGVEPSLIPSLRPGESVPVTVTITIPPHAAGDDEDRVKIIVFRTGEYDPVETALDTVIVSYTTGTRYVAVSGSDDHNNCTMREGQIPCRTVQHAVDQAVHGDTVKVAGGDYVDVLGAGQVVRVSESITLTGGYATDDWDNSDPVARPTKLDAEGQPGRGVVLVDAGITPTIEGFHLLRGYVADDGAGLYIAEGSTPTVRLNRIYSNTAVGADRKGGGVYFGGGDLTLERNAIYGNRAAYGAGLYLNSGEAQIWSNLIYRNEADYYGGGLYSFDGFPLIWHNTFYSNTANDGGGIYAAAGTPVVSNTIVVNNAGHGVRKGGSAGYDLAYNDVWGNTPRNYYGVLTGTHDISADPRFADASVADLRLTFGSPCIDAGDPNSSQPPDKDYEGNDRLLLGGYDIGAFEYGMVSAKTVTRTAQPDTVITYVVQVTNTGSVAHTILVTDTLHRYLDYTGTLTYTAGQAEYVSSTRTVSWTVPVAGDDTVVAITFTARITRGVGYGTPITNLAWVDWGRIAVVTTTVTPITGTRYVDGVNGDDTDNDCTLQRNPCQTVQRAVDQAQPGDEVKVAAGTYTDLTAAQVVSVSKAIILTGGYDPSDWEDFDPVNNETTLQARSGRPCVVIGPVTVTVSGFHIVGGTEGISVTAGNLTLVRSWVHGNTDGVKVDGGIYELVNSIIVQNSGAGLRAVNSDGIVVHNTFAGNTGGGAVISGTARITNTIFSTHTTAVNVTDGSAELWNALWWANAFTVTGAFVEHSPTISNPLFVDPGGLDYHIQETSGAVDKGVDTGLTEDIDGEARWVMEWPDIGADEYPLGLTKYGPEYAEPDETIVYTIELKAKDVGLLITDVLPIHLTYTTGTVTCTVPSCGYLASRRAITWAGDSDGYVVITYTGRLAPWLGQWVVITNTAELERQGNVNESAECETVITPVHGIRYVAPNGADVDDSTGTDNNCLMDWKPCATVQWAVDQALAGDTVKVAQGVYTSTAAQVVLVDKAITLTGGCTTTDWTCDPEVYQTYLDGQDSRRVVYINGTSGPVTVDGFHIRNGRIGTGGAGLRANDVVVTLSRNRVYSNTASGSAGGGIYLSGADAVLTANQIYANTSDSNGGGMFLWNTDSLMDNNIVAANQAAAGDGLYLDSFGTPRAFMRHNTIADNAGDGLYVGGFGVAMTNTILVGHSVGIETSSAAVVTATRTLWDGAGTFTSGGGAVSQTDTFTGDPKFVNPAARDYHIGVGSAAFDAGVDSGVTADVDGDVRPMGHQPDVGADELRVELSVTKEAEPGVVQPGERLTYTIRVTNTGQLTLTAAITDYLPTEVTTSDTTSWSSVSIDPGNTWSGVIVVTVNYNVSGEIVNVVRVTSDEGATGVYTETAVVTDTPDITVAPLLLSATLNPNVERTDVFTIGNVGAANLNWSLAESPSVNWLDETPTSGVVAPSGSAGVVVTFTAPSSEGVYNTTLQVSSNDPDTPRVDVQVTLTVTLACIPVAGADFAFAPSAPSVGETVVFTGTATGTSPISYTWDFGDGTGGAGQSVTHSYNDAITYTVRMTATNGCGEDSASRQVVVREVVPPEHYIYLPLVLRNY